MPRIDLVGSTTLSDTVHKGPNQAGNKGLLSYNNQTGIPGCTVFCPSVASLGLPVKGFEHTGRPAEPAAVDKLTMRTVDPRKTSQYADDYLKVPKDTAPFSKTGGGYWISQRTVPPHTAFIATTTYRNDVLNGAQTAAAQVERSQGLASTLVGYEAARQANDVRRSISCDPRARAEATARGIGTQTVRPGSGGSLLDCAASSSARTHQTLAESLGRPATVPNTFGELPGYQTTYGSMNDKTARELGASLLTRPATSAPPGDPRFKTLPRVMAPGYCRNYTTYSAEYGPDGADPMAREPAAKETMTRGSTTRDLATGTTRNVSHIPRYTGHIPASQYATPQGRAQGEAAEPRPDHKAQALPFKLDQYPRGRVPGYTGYKTQAACNVDVAHTQTLPCMGTTAGEAGLRGTAFGVPEQSHEHYINSRAGLMTFFNSSNVGTQFQSDNGLYNAQVYFKQVKPNGTLGIKHSKPSEVTHYGATFRAAASMV